MDMDINVLLGGIILACGAVMAALIFLIRKLNNRTNAQARRRDTLKARLYHAQDANQNIVDAESGIIRYMRRRRDMGYD